MKTVNTRGFRTNHNTGLRITLACFVFVGCRPAAENPEEQPKAEDEGAAHVSRTAEGAVAVTLDEEAQTRIGLRVEALAAATHRPESIAYGILEEDPAGAFTLRAPMAGVVRCAEGRGWPAIGERLVADAGIGWIEPRLGPVEQVDLATRAVQARAEFDEAVAALSAARASYESKKALNAENKVVSDRALEEAEAKVKGAEARCSGCRRIVSLLESSPTTNEGIARVPLRVAQDGDVINVGVRADEVVEAGQMLLKVVSYDAFLARVELPIGAAMDPTATSARIVPVSDESSSLQGERVAQTAASDAGPKGLVFLYRVQRDDRPLRPGQPVIAYLPASGGELTGVRIPRSAVVRTSGRTWIYVQVSVDTFVRREVLVTNPIAEGWFATSGFSSGDRIVVEGAHTLLSEELKPTIEQEEAAGE